MINSIKAKLKQLRLKQKELKHKFFNAKDDGLKEEILEQLLDVLFEIKVLNKLI